MPQGHFQIQIKHAFNRVIVMIFRKHNLPLLKELVGIISAPSTVSFKIADTRMSLKVIFQ